MACRDFQDIDAAVILSSWSFQVLRVYHTVPALPALAVPLTAAEGCTTRIGQGGADRGIIDSPVTYLQLPDPATYPEDLSRGRRKSMPTVREGYFGM